MSVYVDTSAAAKLLLEEAESAALGRYLEQPEIAAHLVASALLETELRRVASRAGLPQRAVSEVLARIDLVEPNRSLFREAGVLPGRDLRSLDALHLATALRVDADLVVAYDVRLLEAAAGLGLTVASPSQEDLL